MDPSNRSARTGGRAGGPCRAGRPPPLRARLGQCPRPQQSPPSRCLSRVRAAMDYRDFELRIRSDRQGNLWTDLVRSPFGVAEAPFNLPLANGMAERLLERTLRDAPRREAGAAAERHLRVPGPVVASELPSPREVGGALFEALLAGDVATRF